MTFTERTTRCLGIFALALSSWATMAQAAPEPEILMPRQLTQNLCSNTNTASMSANLSTWQTNGLCTDFCRDKNYAFAIVQWQSCWCSDVAPAASSEAGVSDKCNDICPGYDIEHCGSRPNYYGYLTLAKTPTSTAGSGGDSSSSSKAAASTTAQQNTVTPDPETTTTSTTTTSSSSKPRSTVQTVTADGTVRTIFVTPTATGTEGATGAPELTPGNQSSSNGPSTGAVVGIVVGVIAAVVAIAGLGLFLLFRRRRQQQNENDKYDEPSHRGSSAGMTGSPRNPEMVVTVDGGRWDPDASSDHRRSRLLAHDPRLDPLPRGLYVHNKSAESINTLRDDQDYSRKVHQPVLRATNPDPDT